MQYIIFKNIESTTKGPSDGRKGIVNDVPYEALNDDWFTLHKVPNSLNSTTIAVKNTTGNNNGVAYMSKRLIAKYVNPISDPEYFL